MPTLTVEFAGGLESYFHNKSQIVFTTKPIETNKCAHLVEQLPQTMRELILVLKNNFLSVKEDLFLEPVNDTASLSFTIRPGILTLVDDVDWEILGTINAELDDAKRVTFISTLHGG